MTALAAPVARTAPLPRERRARPSPIAMRTVRVDGVEARYLLAGSGAPLLIVASPLVLARSYLPAIRALSPWFTVVVAELPGAGGSNKTRRAWTFERYGAFALELVRRLPLAAPVLVGHSDSAPVAVEAARLAPEDLRALVLVGPCGACEPRSAARMIVARARDAISEPAFGARVLPHLVANAVRHRRTFFDHVLAAARADVLESARGVRVPTLLAWGARDRTAPLACATRLGRALPDAKLVVGRGAHDFIATEPEAFCAALRRFLSERASP